MAVVETDTDTAPPSFRQAFDQAKEEHSAKEQAPPAEVSTETETEEPVPDAEAPAGTTKADATADPAGLISDVEFNALQAKHAKDPVALRRELDKVFTQKTQKLSEDRKTFERVKPYVELIDAFNEDSQGTLAALADQYGFTLSPKAAAAVATAGDQQTKAAGEEAVDAVVSDFRTALGPDLEYLADALAPAIQGLVEKLTKSTVEAETKPLRDQQRTILTRAAQDQTDLTMKAFGDAHPDWQSHETAMMEIAATLSPNGLKEPEYLERLYQLATRDSWEKDRDTKIADGVKAALAKMQKGADTRETHERSTPATQVTNRPPGVPTFAEAAEAAKQGIRWD